MFTADLHFVGFGRTHLLANAHTAETDVSNAIG